MSRLQTALRRLAAKHHLAYATQLGSAWIGDSLKLMRCIPDRTVNAIITSPPFALISEKEYGNVDQDEYVKWFLPFAEQFHRILRKDGSLIIEIGGTWVHGAPIRSLYHYELTTTLVRKFGFHLAQDFFWVHEGRIPTPAAWVTVRRVRVKDAVNPIWWLSKSKHPKADNRRVLNPYAAGFKPIIRHNIKLRHLREQLGLNTKGKKRVAPSGYALTEDSFSVDNGGAIPDNLLRCHNMASSSPATERYFKYCKQHGYEAHPARFPPDIPQFFLKFLTEPGDLILDPFGGSNTTGELADTLGRRWLSFELSADYLKASVGRFHPSRLLRHPPGLPRPRCRWHPASGPKFQTRSR